MPTEYPDQTKKGYTVMNQSIKIDQTIFRAYDIRGKVGEQLSEEIVELIGKGFGTYVIRSGGERVAVGRDNRDSSAGYRDALACGLQSSGCDVVDIGLSTSPLLYFSVIEWEFDAGIIVTGSHLEPIYNGLKLVGRRAYPIASDEIRLIRDIILRHDFEIDGGSFSTLDPIPRYLERIQQPFKLARPLKVVVDAGNGVPGVLAPHVFRNLGCDVIELYCDLDSTFPNHLPDPEKEENLRELRRSVLENVADIGIAFDGDGDRIGVIDELGIYRETDLIIILLARDYLSRHPGEKILFDVKSSQNVIDDIAKHGGNPILWKTGHSLIKQKMRDDYINFGAEFSGHIFAFEDYYPVDDAFVAASRVLSVLAAHDIPLSQHWNELPELYATPLIELPCEDAEAKFEAVSQVVSATSQEYDVITIDGARVSFEHGWVVIRASNTSENLTVRCEADSLQNLIGIAETAKRILLNRSGVDVGPLEREIFKLERLIKILDMRGSVLASVLRSWLP